MIPWLPPEPVFPPVRQALVEPNGLLAAGGDLSPARLLAAYQQGIFPWFSAGDPILWWSPDPRMVLLPGDIRITRSFAKTLRNADYTIKLDSAFAQVVAACATTARDGQTGTWIVPAMQSAYGQLHELGHAHSVETWHNGTIIGGLYGVAIGKMFFGESMFSRARDASKIALAHLCRFLLDRNFGIIDCQMETSHLTSLGARIMARDDFLVRLAALVDQEDLPGKWPTGCIDGIFRRRSI